MFGLLTNVSWETTKYQSSQTGIKWITITETEFCLFYLNVRERIFFYHLICPVSFMSDYLTFEFTRLQYQ